MDNIITSASPPLTLISMLHPVFIARPATETEQTRIAPWAQVNAVALKDLEVAEYSDGQSSHSPEVIAAYHEVRQDLPEDFVLIYVHRGVQIDCIHPLLASLLQKTGHRGKSHALRQHGQKNKTAVGQFARAVTPRGGAAMLIDDHQIRVGTRHEVVAATVSISTFFNTQHLITPQNGASR